MYPQKWSYGHEEPTVKLYTDYILYIDSIVIPSDSMVKNPPAIQGTPVQLMDREDLLNSCLENLMDRGAWWATDHRVAKSWT